MMAIRLKAPSIRTLLDVCAATLWTPVLPILCRQLGICQVPETCVSMDIHRPRLQSSRLGTLLIPIAQTWDSTHYVVKEDTSVYGGLNLISGYGIHSSLDEALTTAEKCTGGAFMTFVGNTTALIPFTVGGSEGQKYAVFDSHALSATGALDETGTSVLTYHDTLADVSAHYRASASTPCLILTSCSTV